MKIRNLLTALCVAAVVALSAGISEAKDWNKLRVGVEGAYPPFSWMETDGTLFGYAADGFEIHYVGSDAQSSWQLKAGERASGPGGAHDGTYVQDYEFVEGSGTLDECNGGTLDGQYVYFATDTYPFFPRCFRGTVSSDFIGGRGERPPRDDAGPTPAP